MYMSWFCFGYDYRLSRGFACVLILLLFFLSGCNFKNFKDEDRAIALVQNYQIGGKRVVERLSYALLHSTSDKIDSLKWDAFKEKEKLYKVTCTAKVGGKELYFVWLANLSSKRITPLNMVTQDVMGGGFY